MCIFLVLLERNILVHHLMERKLSAVVEIQAKQNDGRSQTKFELGESTCSFKPCEVATCFYEYPLKIFQPTSVTSSCCQWIYPMVFGGGLVEGDEVNISVTIGKNCCVLLTTLSFPKVYCCENGLDSQQHGKFIIDSDTLFCVIPDPVVCYQKACYVQAQTFYLTSTSNIVLLDWYTSGRYTRGERWAFTRLKCVSKVFINDRLACRESQWAQSTSTLSLDRAMKSYNLIGTCIIIGPLLLSLSSTILSELGKCLGYGQKPKKEFLIAASPLLVDEVNKGCVIRFASESVDEAVKKMEEILEPVFTVIGGNPFRNK